MKLLNALALGIPVVAFSSAVRSMPGVVLCENIQDMESALRMLLLDPRRCDQLGREGKEHVLHKYSWEKVAIEVEKIYTCLYR